MSAVGRYQLEAAAQSAHAVPRLIGATDWAAIELIYDALLAISPGRSRSSAWTRSRWPAGASILRRF
jgi:hypothetical protein